MVAPLVMAGIGAGMNVLGGVLGNVFAGVDDAEYERLMEEAASIYGDLSEPELRDIVAQKLARSAQEDAPSDFGNKAARNAAIQALMEQGYGGGRSFEDKLTLATAQRAAGQATRAASQGALQSAAARGMGGAASTLQAQLLGGSQGADRAAQVGLQGASDARRAALQAMTQGGSMAGTAEASDAALDARRRESMDAIARFNAEQQAATDRYNSGLQQQRFENTMSVRDRKAQAQQTRAGLAQGRGERKRRMWGGAGQAIGAGVDSYLDYAKGK